MAPRFCMGGIWIVLGVAAIVGIDQISKHMVVSSMDLGEDIPVIDGFFDITYIQNTGAAFGMFSNGTQILTVITGLILIAAIVLVAVKAREIGKYPCLFFTLIIGGGLGNLADRFFLGYVVDFLDFKVWSPIFNVADIFVCVGCGLFMIYVIFVYGKENERKDQTDN